MAIFNNKVKAAVVFVTVVWLLYGRKELWPTGRGRFRGSGTVGDLGKYARVPVSRMEATPGGGGGAADDNMGAKNTGDDGNKGGGGRISRKQHKRGKKKSRNKRRKSRKKTKK